MTTTTMEKLFVQIFERKRWIVQQVKHQIDLYDQHLASKCLIDGISPPPWLWSQSSGNDLNKEEIISGLLFPHPRPSVPWSASRGSSYQQPFVTVDNVETQNFLCTGANPLNEGLHEGKQQQEHRLNDDTNNIGRASAAAREEDPGVSSPVHCRDKRVLDCASTAGCEQDPRLTSPGHWQDEIVLDSHPEPPLSLARIQRSKSRQRALETRTSAKASKRRTNDKRDLEACANENKGEEIDSLRNDCQSLKKLSRPVKENEEGCTVEEMNNGHLQSKERDQVVCFSGALKSGSPGQKVTSGRDISSVGRFASLAPQSGRLNILFLTGADELDPSKPINRADEGCASEAGDLQPKKGSENAYSGRITRSRSRVSELSPKSEHSNFGKSSSVELQSRSSNASVRSGHETELPKPSTENGEGLVTEEPRADNSEHKKGSETVLSGRMTRSRSLAHESNSKIKCSSAAKSTAVDIQSRSSNAFLRSGHETELFKPVTVNGEDFVAEEPRVDDSEQKTGNEIILSGRITRFRNLAHESSSKAEHSNVDKSSSVELWSRSSNVSLRSGNEVALFKPVAVNGEGPVAEESRADKKVSEKIYSSRSTRSRSMYHASGSKIESPDVAKSTSVELESRSSDASFRSGHQMELSMPITANDEGHVVEEVRTDDVQSKEKSGFDYSNQISRSRSLGPAANTMSEDPDVGKPLAPENDGRTGDSIKQSRGLIEPSTVCDDGFGSKKAKAMNSWSKNENKHHFGRIKRSRSLSKQHELAQEFNCPSVSSESKLVGDQLKVGTDLLSSPPHDIDKFVKPKQLDFDDSEEYNLDEASSLALTRKMQDESMRKESPIPQSPAKELDTLSCIDCREKLTSDDNLTILEEHRVLKKEEKACKSSSIVHGDLETLASVLEETNIVSSVNETSKGQRDVVTNNCRNKNYLSMPNPLSDESTNSGLLCNYSIGNLQKEDIGEVDVLKHASSASVSSNQGKIISGDHKTPMKTYISVVGPVVFSSTCISSTDPMREHSSAALTNGVKSDSMQRRTSCLFEHQIEKSSLVQSNSSKEKNLACSGSSQNHIPESYMQGFSSCSPTIEGSLRQHKRRKTEGQLSKKMPTSPGLRDTVLDSCSGKSQVGMVQHGTEHNSLEHYNVELQKMIASASSSRFQSEEDCSLLEEMRGEAASLAFEVKQLSIQGGKVLHHEDGLRNSELEMCAEETSQLFTHGKVLHDPVHSPHCQSMGLKSSDQSLPVLERFIVQAEDEHPCGSKEQIITDRWELPKSTVERASILEQICRSACMNSPSLHLPATYKFDEKPNLHQSVPSGLLEGMFQSSSLNGGIEHDLHGRSHSDCMPFSGAEFSAEVKNHCASPFAKPWSRSLLKSVSSEKRVSSSPDLPCIDEENENMDESAVVFQEEIFLEKKNSFLKRKPLADIEENKQPPLSLTDSKIPVDRDSLDSVKTEFSFIDACNIVKGKAEKQNVGRRRCTGKGKENQSVLRRATGAKRDTGSLHNRFSKPKFSGNTSLSSQGPRLSEKEPKCKNIVSNITSFIPLVQPKQPAGVITGKRDVKVKALEAAEAAKRLAEKKENERKMKKEALKFERARQEQENLRKQELEKKKKEEERKKKEAEMAERKRQREEEERKLKEAKRKRFGEAQRHAEKLPANKEEKDSKLPAADESTHAEKESKGVEKIRQESGNDNPGKMSKTESQATKFPKSDPKAGSETVSSGGNNCKVTSNSGKGTENAIFFSDAIEESYEISPYKGSDDEDEEEDDLPNSKFVPAWASKNCVVLAVSSQQHIDPEKIFTPDSFCSISEVLMPRKHQLKQGARQQT